jgi:hypothetical protein
VGENSFPRPERSWERIYAAGPVAARAWPPRVR